jgi:hypothetical protein
LVFLPYPLLSERIEKVNFAQGVDEPALSFLDFANFSPIQNG